MKNSALWTQFHSMWGKAKDNAHYSKQDWNNLQLLIEEAENPNRDGQRRFTVPGPAAPVILAAMLVEEQRGFHVKPIEVDKELLFQFTVEGEDALPLPIRQWIAKANDQRPPAY